MHSFDRACQCLKLNRKVWCLGVMLMLMSVPTLALAQEPVEKVMYVNITNGILPPDQRLITVYKNDKLRWRFTSNTSGEVHLHAYRLRVPLQAGQVGEMVLTAFATGKFRLEWHPTDAKPPLAGVHHAPALAVLEVRPH